MQLTEKTLQEIFVLPGHISESEFVQAVQNAQKKHTTIEEQIVASGLVSDYNAGKGIADALELPFFDLSTVSVSEHHLSYIPEIVARAQHAVVFEETEDVLHVATLHPDNYAFQKLLEKKFGKQVVFFYVAQGALKDILNTYKGDYGTRIRSLLDTIVHGQKEGSVVELVDLLFEYGYESGASDIHFEPLEHEIRIRFRIDGVLHEVMTYPLELHEQVSFRVKILAQLQTDEHDAAQDGRFSLTINGETFDVRVSIIPVTNGENIVVRLLSSSIRQYTLETLGFSKDDYKKVKQALSQPHGMILSVGPTGSGKTTVLYTMVERLNTPEVNIMTIEDPVEYDIENVSQTQVNRSKNLIFSSGLRAIVRQDPDIIMVGEIRDEETADIAVNAALTGHLLLSTLHTNDAATTFPRLTEMGVEPFLAASSVRLIVSLRLVRTVCGTCKQSYFLSSEERSIVQNATDIHALISHISGKTKLTEVRFYKGTGCASCHNTGFKGRSAIFELLEVTDPIRLLISKKASAREIHELACKEGMHPLAHDGVAKALAGVTTIQEVLKAAYS